MSEWGFITNHRLVLAAIAKHPRSTAREVGDDVGITERAAHKIIKDLDAEGYNDKAKVGRRNAYQIYADLLLKDNVSDTAIGELLIVLGAKRKKGR
jgi:predicted transcriptional regulator